MSGVATMGKNPVRTAIIEENIKQPTWRFSEDESPQPTIEGRELATKLLEELSSEIAKDEKAKPSKSKRK